MKHYLLTILFISINLFVFLLFAKSGSISSEKLIEIGAFYEPLVKKGEYYRFITSLFLHTNLEHLLSNVLSIITFGFILEKTIGSFSFFIIYFLSGIGANILKFSFYDGSASVGASGSVFGLFGAFMIVIIIHWKDVNEILKYVISFMVGGQIFYTFFGENINVFSHIGGFLTGFLLTFLLLIALKLKLKQKNSLLFLKIK